MEYSSPTESALLRSGSVARGSDGEGMSGSAVSNPEYVGRWEVVKQSETSAQGQSDGSDDRTLTESMAGASISGSVSREPRPILPRPPPPHLVLFQRGGPQVLEMYEAPRPPPPPGWNSHEMSEHFIYEGEARPASAPPQTMQDEAETEDEQSLVQVDAVAEDVEEEEDEMEEEQARSMPLWQNPQIKRRARQAFELLNQDVIDAMPTEKLIYIMQAGFHSLMSRRIRH